MSAEQDFFSLRQLVEGRYRIESLIGRGGMGQVYRARDVRRDRAVALKVLKPDLLTNDKARRRFEREVAWTREIRHPNVIRVYEVFTTETVGGHQTPCLAMELLDGESLVDRLDRGAFNCDQAKVIVSQMASALAAAHDRGIVHRDLKPANVFLVDEGGPNPRAVLTDFGVARRLPEYGQQGDDDLTASNIILGTPDYMAPELLELEEAIPASDLYALGMVFYEMVTGEPMYGGDKPLSALFQRVSEAAPSPRSKVPDLDDDCERVILRCLERQPEDRYASADDVVHELGGDVAAIHVVPRGLAEPSVVDWRSWTMRDRLAASFATCATLALIALVVWFYAAGSG